MNDLIKELSELNKNLDRQRIERNLLRKQYRGRLKEKKQLNHFLEKQLAARKWIQEIAKATQNKISGGVESLVSKSLRTTFKDPYSFKVDFVTRRNKTECDLFFTRRGFIFDPMNCSGGGSTDVASFSLRLTFWVLDSNLRPILFMDEPFKYLSVDLQSYCSEMLAMMSQEMQIQMIIVSHLPKLINHANRIIDIHLEDDVSIISQGEII